MEKFNLEKALAGNPVKLRNGKKAFVKYQMPKEMKYRFLIKANQIAGFVIDNEGFFEHFVSWNNEGKYQDNMEHDLDIMGMWSDSQPRVKLDLPAPLAKAKNGNKVFTIYGTSILEFIFDDKQRHLIEPLNNGELFATAEDAQEWINAMRNSRR